jgi:23S rRNA (cytosine1962-C5)-methyltransferase
VVLRNDTAARRLEGLPDDPDASVRALREVPGLELRRAALRVAAPPEAGLDGRPLALRADLLEGQKTGFYLDQAANVRLAAGLLAALLRSDAPSPPDAPLRILDLFCYVGQWGAQLARVAAQAGRAAHVTALDSSAPALALAAENAAAVGAACEPVRADALETLDDLPARAYDVVVADPPAFIKGRKAYPTGRAAYGKLNAAALRRVRPGGLFVTCSCSQLLEEAAFLEVLDKAARRAEVCVRWVAHGGQAPDHPILAGFPEGRYLKCWVGVVG